MDRFNFFCLANEDKRFLSQYISPSREASTFKKIPIEHLDRVKKLLRQLGYRARIIYRGPRGHSVDQSMTWKQDARAFSVYPA